MLIQLNKEWRITSDPLNIRLENKKGKDKNGDDRWVVEGYWSSLDKFAIRKALDGYVDKKIRLLDKEGCQAILNLLDEMREDIEEVGKYYKPTRGKQ